MPQTLDFPFQRNTITLCKIDQRWGMMLDQFALAMGYQRPLSARFLLSNHAKDIEAEISRVEGDGEFPEFISLKGVRYLAARSSMEQKGRELIEWLDYIDDKLRMVDHSEKAIQKKARRDAMIASEHEAHQQKKLGLADTINHYFSDRMVALGFRARSPQLLMAQRVAEAIECRKILLAEAGVGTGKTFAYLIPALYLLEDGIVVSTNTHVLQDQILLKDIPELSKFDLAPNSALVAKGKANYLCKAKLLKGGFPKEALADIQRLMEWALEGNHEGGTLRGIPRESWELVANSRYGDCRQCKVGAKSGCQYHQAREDWQKGKGVLITNHNQLLAAITAWKKGRNAVFPPPKALIIDEAHNFLSAVEDHLTKRLEAEDESRIRDLVQRLRQSALAVPERLLSELTRYSTQVIQRIQSLPLAKWTGEDEGDRLDLDVFPQILAEELYQLANAARKVVFHAEKYRERPVNVDYLDELAVTCKALIGSQALCWIEGPAGLRKLCVLSQDPEEWLKANLFEVMDIPILFISATLSVGGDFSYIKGKLGLSKQRRLDSVSVPSCFDYDANVRLSIPSTMPIFNHETSESYYQAAFKHVSEVIERVKGNALVLFTSKESVRDAKAYFLKHPIKGKYKLLFQTGESGTQTLVNDFKSIPGSCLFGTAFWEGLDVPGKKLSTVVVMKLPFPVPNPLIRREEEKAFKRGQDPMEAVILPKMMLRLKQGIGRLIRHEEDRGNIVILDTRARKYVSRWSAILPYQEEPEINTELADLTSS